MSTGASGRSGSTDLWHRGPQAASDVLRALTSAAVMLSAVTHFELWATGMKTVDVVGPAFLLNAVGGIVLGILLLVWRHWLPLLGAVGFGIATLTAFTLSTTSSGFFGVHGRWEGVPEWISAISEAAAVVLAIAAYLVERKAARPTA